MFGLGFQEILVIALIVLLLWGGTDAWPWQRRKKLQGRNERGYRPEERGRTGREEG